MYPTSSVKLSPYPEYNPQVNPSYARNADDAKYIVTTKIMVLALAVLFAVVFFVVCLHIYAKWVWSTSPAGLASFSFWRPRRHSDDVVDALDSVSMANMGLGEAALEALPKFRYEEVCEKGHLECPICLGKFEDGEMGRALPKCGHCFHLECIDMWLFSHSTCPLCRAVLDPEAPPEPAVADPLPLPEEDKRDSIPANVLFWGNHELARLSVNNNSSQGHVVIEVSHEPLQLPPRGGSLHRLLGRGARVVVTPFRPSPSPSSSSSSSSSSGVNGEH